MSTLHILKIGQQQKVTIHAQYIIHVDKTNTDYSNNGSEKHDSHMEIMYTRTYDK